MKQNRREFLKTTALTAAATVASPLFASQKSTAGEDYKALVCVLLEGGADTVNMVIPKADLSEYLQYAKVRPHTAHNREQIRTLKGTNYGLHPRMSRMQRLYNYDNLAVVANVGTLSRPLSLAESRQAKEAADVYEHPEQLFSHAAQRDLWMHTGNTENGWAARVADLMQEDHINISVGGLNTMQYGGKQESIVVHDDIYGTHPMLEKVRKARVDTYFDKDESTEGKSLGEQLDMVVDLIEHRKVENFPKRQIFFVSYSGWDLHNAPSDGTTAAQVDAKVAYMDKSFGEFFSALKKLGLSEKVTTFTISDFGRSIEATGEDHGWGGHAFVIGGAVKSGIYGKMPEIARNSPDALANGALIPTLSAEQYMAPLVAWLGDGKINLNHVFPNLAKFSDKKLNFLA